MKKLFLTLAIAFFIFSCDAENMSTDNNNSGNNTAQYLTVTYHKDDGTQGEPPVDTKRYRKPDVIDGLYRNAESATILDHGTMVKEGYFLEMWKLRNPGYPNMGPEWSLDRFYPGSQIVVEWDLNFDPVWLKLPE